MATADGNVQDMSVHDKEHPSLAATEEAQNVAGLNRIVVGMPAFTDPHNPMTQSGSVNLPLDQHPVTHSEDYGADVTPGSHLFVEGQSPMAVGAATLTEDDEGAKLSTDAPESRQEAVEARSKELHGMPREDLDTLAAEYDIDPAEHSRKEDLAEAILTAEQAQD
jgi:hypothetical protein